MELYSLAVVALFLLCKDSGHAQFAPALINYQGQIQNADGSTPPTADYSITFSIYDSATGGSAVWGPQQFDGEAGEGHGPKIPVVQGYFNVLLGAVDSSGRLISDAFNGADRFVEIKFSDNPPITPRQRFSTTPYAFRANAAGIADNAAKLAGHDWSALLTDSNPTVGTLQTTRIAPDSIGSAQIGPSAVGTSELANTGVTLAKLAGNSVDSTKIVDGSIQLADLNTSVANAFGIPPGTIVAFAGATPPPGWLLCNGSQLNRLGTYSALYAAIGTVWGTGNGSTTFHIPDLRGVFLRGVTTEGATTWGDPGPRINRHPGGQTSNVGSYQLEQLGAHTHGAGTGTANGNLTAQIMISGGNNLYAQHRSLPGWASNDATANAEGGLSHLTAADRGVVVVGNTSANNNPTSETRPKNAFVNYIIKF